jgi:hypothetical protein
LFYLLIFLVRNSLLWIVASLLLAAGCKTSSSLPTENSNGAIAIYDNHGGFAYPGLRIILHRSGKYELQQYTDVRTEHPPSETGTFNKTGLTYVLTSSRTSRTFHALKKDGREYLVDAETYSRYLKTKDSHELDRSMRRSP